MSFERLRAGVPPVKLIEGKDQFDREAIEVEQERVTLYRDLILSAHAEAMTLFLNGVLEILASHNENVAITKTVLKQSFITTIQGISEDFEGGINDAISDLLFEMGNAIEEDEDDED